MTLQKEREQDIDVTTRRHALVQAESTLQNDAGFLPDIILSTICGNHWGIRLNPFLLFIETSRRFVLSETTISDF